MQSDKILHLNATTRPRKSIFSHCTYREETQTSVANNAFKRSNKEVPPYEDKLKNCQTQTSKTILELAKREVEEMSADSLSDLDSPGNITKEEKKLLTQHYNVSFMRKYNLNQYLVNHKEDSLLQSPKEHVHPNTPACIQNKTLTETFLEKKQNLSATSKVGEFSTNRSQFLQQTSPLRKLNEKELAALKSKSFIEPRVPAFGANATRFKVTSVVESKSTADRGEYPVRNFCRAIKVSQNEDVSNDESGDSPRSFRLQSLGDVEKIPGLSQRTFEQTDVKSPRKNLSLLERDCCKCFKEDCIREENELSRDSNHYRKRCNSFMMPTIASNRKNKTPDIEKTKSLISSTKRGKSSSPRKCASNLKPQMRVPYIDQSDSRVSNSASTFYNEKLNSLDEDLLKLNFNFPIEKSNVYDSSPYDGLFSTSLNKLRNQDWNVSIKGLAEIVELSRIIDTDLIYPHMPTINQRLIDLLRSPRSHVCRTACQGAGHLFEYLKDTRRPEFDEVVEILLFKTADTNRFIRQDANLALDCMVTHITPCHAVRALCSKGPTHKNHLVRVATVRLLICVVVIASPGSILNPNNSDITRKRIIVNLHKFIVDKNYETRKFGERLYKVMCKDSRFDVYLKKYLDKDSISQMKKQIKYSSKTKKLYY